MPWAASHAGTSPRRPVVATTRSAASTVPSSRRTPVTVGGPSTLASSSTPATPRPTRKLDAGLGEHRPAHDPLEGGATARQHAQVVVGLDALRASPRRARRVRRRAAIGGGLDAEVGSACSTSGKRSRRIVRARPRNTCGWRTWGAPRAVPVEGGLGVGRHGGVVALDERDAVAGPRPGRARNRGRRCRRRRRRR